MLAGGGNEIRVLIVDDSPTVCSFLTMVLGAAPGIKVIGAAGDGDEALRRIALYRPDLVTMDIQMPGMDGFAATRKILEVIPVPIVIVSGQDLKEVDLGFQAIEAGALAMVAKPPGFGHPGHEAAVAEMITTVRLMAEVKVVRRWAPQAKREPVQVPVGVSLPQPRRSIHVVAVGASTGGPNALQQLLEGLPQPFPAPLLVVQHIAHGFNEGFAQWLGRASGFPVSLVGQDEALHPGRAYLAPEDRHLGVTPDNRAVLSQSEPEYGMRPAVSFLFRSVAAAHGPNAAGILLTGMGADGGAELKLMRDQGAATFAQSEETSIVFGMPGVAVGLGGAAYVLSPQEIARVLDLIVRKERSHESPMKRPIP